MLCCAIGLAAVATGALGWRRFRGLLCRRLTAQSILAVATAAMIVVTASGLGVVHVFGPTAHAAGSLPTGPLPLCSASAADTENTRE
jgi:hypothetical protein